ncbi:MAG: aldolase [Pigmentiphaga sp.]
MSKTLVVETSGEPDNPADRQTFAQACRILADQGHGAGLAGQLTLRNPDATLLTLPLGIGFDEATPECVIRVDEDLNVLEGQGKANPAVRFHVWIYRRRPDLAAVVHTHPPALSALSMLGRPLPVAHMDAAMFHDDCGFLGQWPGVPTGDEEGELISDALGHRRSVFLANHGIVCAGASLQEAIYLNVFAERNARACLDALAVGPLQPVADAAAQEAHDFLLQPAIVNATFAYWVRQALPPGAARS